MQDKIESCQNILLNAIELGEIDNREAYIKCALEKLTKLEKGKVAEVLIFGGSSGHAVSYTYALDQKATKKTKATYKFTIIDTDKKSVGEAFGRGTLWLQRFLGE
ncbi:MAG: hypothetical protein H0W50_04940 [Parachlamydiaceae bacterium]|nr:hypothetical protein [Parachlamydiaceae bacterium]